MQFDQYTKKVFIVILLVFLFSDGVAVAKTTVVSLAEFEWENRIVLVNVSDATGTGSVEALFKLHKDALDERHIVWFMVSSQGQSQNVISNFPGNISNSMLREIKTMLSGTANDNLVLIGKDGGVKSRDNGLNIESIFEQIDQMPMRQYEMQMQKSQKK